ncbi:hypothetical protein [Chondromyces apiculatus]|uniref:Uncharacterized protein n=1 Tax=Chondromyces apiculatus DSM 436 TaxID=1192034 RepID=A0A017SYP2_9BACT|nr:hypothetical protein [Chondromyces apiculatus]EYF02043.1 Hypothetical protein CAP_7522 [Chondromyces apiculatus DSM 436]
MQSLPPDPEGLDSAWDDEDEDEPREDESTRLIDSKELFERAGFTMEEATGDEPPVRARSGRITARAPSEEYSAHVSKARPSGAHENLTPQTPKASVAPPVGESYEETLDALLQERGFDLECDEPGVPSAPGASVTARGSSAGDPRVAPPGSAPGRLGDPRQPPPGSGARLSRPDEDAPQVDIDFELGFDMPDLAPDEHPVPTAVPTPIPGSFAPMTPPPGTLRLGLIDDEFDPLNTKDWLGDRSLPPSVVSGVSGRAPLSRTEGAHAPTLIPGAWPPSPRPSQPAAHTFEKRPSVHAPAPPPLPPVVPSTPPAPTPHTPPTADDRRRQMLQRFESGDYSGALVLAESILDETPDDITIRRYAESCNEMLRQTYKARIGDGSQVLRILISNEQIRSLNLDHRAGFLLSCIDGMSSIDDVLDVCGMRELDALRILYELVQENIVAPIDDGLR